jgi:hypothetical protein
VDYGVLTVDISMKITINIINLVMNITSRMGFNDRLAFIVDEVVRLEMRVLRSNFD